MRWVIWGTALVLFCGFLVVRPAGCRSAAQTKASTADAGRSADGERGFVTMMVAGLGGINDQSYNESAWRGMQQLRQRNDVHIGFLESTQDADYFTNLDMAADAGSDLIWGVGFALREAICDVALMTPDILYGGIDCTFGEDILPNVFGVAFRAYEAAFLAGYAAALTTKTGCIAFVGGIRGDVLMEFECGWRAGAAWAAAELGRSIEVRAQYADSFTDAAKGRAIAASMYANGVDIIFPAAAVTGIGCIEEAVARQKMVVGVDVDQRHLAPNNMLTSVLKNVDIALVEIAERIMAGEALGGKDVSVGLADGAVGLPADNPNMAPEVQERVNKLTKLIAAGKITPPRTQKELQQFAAGLDALRKAVAEHD